MKLKILILTLILIILATGCQAAALFNPDSTKPEIITTVNPTEKCSMPTELRMRIYDSRKLEITGKGKKAFTWKSSDPNTAEVSSDGVVTAKKPGKATITAECKTTKLFCDVKIRSLLIAHRGFSSEYPENTRESFEAAFERGFDGIECDVWDCKGAMMINHDYTTERTSGKFEYIWNVKKKDRKKYPVSEVGHLDKTGGKAPLMPTLKETCEIVSKYNGYLLLHIKTKDSPHRTFTKKAAKKVISLLDQYNIRSKTLIFIYGKKTIGKFRKYDVKLGAFITPKRKSEFKPTLEWCRDNKIGTLILSEMKIVNRYGEVDELKSLADSFGRKIGIYRCNYKSQYEAFSDNGIPFVISDYYFAD